jgi:stress response protein SCP2
MSINLEKKGQKINLKKETVSASVKSTGLNGFTLGLGWGINRDAGRTSSFEYDLDAVALLLVDGKLESTDDVLYYGTSKRNDMPTHKSNQIWLTGDDTVGGIKKIDNEQIIVNLDSLPSKYTEIVFFTTIYQGHYRNQHLGMVDSAYIRAVDDKNVEIARYKIANNPKMDKQCSFVFAKIFKENNEWQFETIGEEYKTDKLMDIADMYRNKSVKRGGSVTNSIPEPVPTQTAPVQEESNKKKSFFGKLFS